MTDVEQALLRKSYQDYKKNFKHVKKDLENEFKSNILIDDKDVKKVETARKAG